MIPNDAQIDLLLKRHAQRAPRDRAGEHLDADELNAFAEGVVPATTRARFVSHLANCDDCRELATQLVVASGISSTLSVASGPTEHVTSWSKKLIALFAPARLRYAAFAVVLLAAAAVTFVALRNQSTRQLPADVSAPSQAEIEVKQSQQAKSDVDTNSKTIAKSRSVVPQPTPAPNAGTKRDESAVAQTTQPALAKPGISGIVSSPEVTTKKAEPRAAETVPSFAPQPPGEAERAQNRSRDQQSIGSLASRKDESANTNFGALDRTRSNVFRGNQNNTEEKERSANDQPQASARRATADKSLASGRETDTASINSRSVNELRIETPKTKEAAKKAPTPAKNVSEDIPETRAVGGRKFRRQDSVWVDTKFKSSMSVRNVSRGSDDYRALNSVVRAIAEQLGGDVIVVSKGKAYRIH